MIYDDAGSPIGFTYLFVPHFGYTQEGLMCVAGAANFATLQFQVSQHEVALRDEVVSNNGSDVNAQIERRATAMELMPRVPTASTSVEPTLSALVMLGLAAGGGGRQLRQLDLSSAPAPAAPATAPVPASVTIPAPAPTLAPAPSAAAPPHRSATLRSATFRGATLRSASRSATFRSATFRSATFRSATFRSATFRSASRRGASRGGASPAAAPPVPAPPPQPVLLAASPAAPLAAAPATPAQMQYHPVPAGNIHAAALGHQPMFAYFQRVEMAETALNLSQREMLQSRPALASTDSHGPGDASASRPAAACCPGAGCACVCCLAPWSGAPQHGLPGGLRNEAAPPRRVPARAW